MTISRKAMKSDSAARVIDLFSTFSRRPPYLLSSWVHPWCSWAPWSQTGRAASTSGPRSPQSFAPTCTQSRLAGSRLETTRGASPARGRKGEKGLKAAMQFLLYAWFLPDLGVIYTNLCSKFSLAIQWTADQLSNDCWLVCLESAIVHPILQVNCPTARSWVGKVT